MPLHFNHFRFTCKILEVPVLHLGVQTPVLYQITPFFSTTIPGYIVPTRWAHCLSATTFILPWVFHLNVSAVTGYRLDGCLPSGDGHTCSAGGGISGYHLTARLSLILEVMRLGTYLEQYILTSFIGDTADGYRSGDTE